MGFTSILIFSIGLFAFVNSKIIELSGYEMLFIFVCVTVLIIINYKIVNRIRDDRMWLEVNGIHTISRGRYDRLSNLNQNRRST
jgi:hypothetical protein